MLIGIPKLVMLCCWKAAVNCFDESYLLIKLIELNNKKVNYCHRLFWMHLHGFLLAAYCDVNANFFLICISNGNKALVKLSRPIQWTPTISPVCLPNDDVPTLNFNMTGLKCVATGWGMQKTAGKLSSKMQQVKMKCQMAALLN